MCQLQNWLWWLQEMKKKVVETEDFSEDTITKFKCALNLFTIERRLIVVDTSGTNDNNNLSIA